MFRVIYERCINPNPCTGEPWYRVIKQWETSSRKQEIKAGRLTGILLPKPRRLNSFFNPQRTTS